MKPMPIGDLLRMSACEWYEFVNPFVEASFTASNVHDRMSLIEVITRNMIDCGYDDYYPSMVVYDLDYHLAGMVRGYVKFLRRQQPIRTGNIGTDVCAAIVRIDRWTKQCIDQPYGPANARRILDKIALWFDQHIQI